MKNPNAIRINNRLINEVESAIAAALSYEAVTKGRRKLGITGEVGEVLVCKKLGLKLVLDPRSEGFDALDKEDLKVQIKTRRSESEGLPRGSSRTSRFSEHKFDYALLALLDHDYQLCEIWRATYRKLKPIIDNQRKRAPSISSFKGAGRKIYPKD